MILAMTVLLQTNKITVLRLQVKNCMYVLHCITKLPRSRNAAVLGAFAPLLVKRCLRKDSYSKMIYGSRFRKRFYAYADSKNERRNPLIE